jgi:hypothetical protein
MTINVKTTKATLVGDLDHDGDVDIDDVVIACMAYGSTSANTTGTWNPEADLAPEFGLIDVFDIVTIVSYYGQTE